MSEHPDRGISPTASYALLGAAFGAVFPLVSTLLEVGLSGAPISFASFTRAQASQPLLWIIDAAPAVLALFGALLGQTQREIETLQREAHERRLASEIERFFTLSPLPMAVLRTEDGAIRRINSGFTAVFGYTLDDLDGQSLQDLMDAPDSEGPVARLEPGAGGGLREEFEVGMRCASGETRLVRWAATSVPDEGATYVIGRDVTEEREAHELLVKAKEAAESASRMKSDFLANISHEVRTPMNGIIGMTGLALETPLTLEQRGFLEAVDESARSLLDILIDILDLSKIHTGMLSLRSAPFHLRKSLYESMKTLGAKAAEKGVELIYDEAADVPERLEGDAGRLRQVIVNLVDNAIKFTDEGEVVVRVAVDQRDGDDVTLRFSVHDTGIGIDEDLKDSIFTAFSQADTSSTRQFGGTGIGLAISSELVSMMRGSFSVESEAGEGSTFSFSADFSVAESAEALDEADPEKPLAERAVLIVDDCATVRRVQSEYVRRLGGRPVAVASALDALGEVRQAHAARSPFDLVVVDAGLDPVDRKELVNSLYADGEIGAPRVILTEHGERVHASPSSAVVVTKPLFPTELLAAHPGPQRLRSDRDAREDVPAPRRRQPWSLKLLLVEDNKVNQMLAVSLLRKRGYDVTVADNGEEAVHLFRDGDFDLILMDLQMPKMDGFEATAEIRRSESQTGARIPIIAVTAHAMEGDRQLCLDAGMDDYVSKPIDPEQLEAAIVRWTGDLPVFEPSRALDLAQGDEDVLESIVKMFLEQTPERMQTIQRALDAGDASGVERSAHTLEGVAVRLALPRLRDIAHRVAVLSATGQLEQAAELMENLKEAVGNGTSAIRDTMREGVA